VPPPAGARPPAAPAAPGAPRPASATPRPPAPSAPPARPASATPYPVSKPAPQGRPAVPPSRPAPAARSAPVAKKAKARPSLSGKNKIGQVLVDLGYVEEPQLEKLLQEAQQLHQTVAHVAMSRGLINEEQMVQALSEFHGLKVVNLTEIKPAKEAIEVVPETMASLYKILPLLYKEGVLTIVMSDPSNLAAIDDLKNLLNIKTVQACLAPARLIEEAIAKYYQGKQEDIVDIIKQLETEPDLRSSHRETSIDMDELMEMAESAPVRKLINMVFLMAIRDHASDVHFEPFEEEYKMRYRCDGVLYEMVPPPRHLAMAIASRIKVMANLDIAERRLPQDGRIELSIGGSQLDMRVSILPTMFGESVVIRVLDRSIVNLELEKVGLDAAMLARFREMIKKPNGIVLVTGPTGAGKTTTLYSALSELNTIADKIITTEDPVEYEIDGLCQVPINADIELTFANALRSILRQDPDIILVGEIRDLETAQIAVQASLTGHLVFSTLHTNDAPSTITRLRDMGIEPFLITATLEGILAQRLVRKICADCKMPFEPGPEQLMELNLRPQDVKGRKFFYGAGCPKCNNTGYKGRSGIFELIVMDDNLRDIVSQGGSTDQIRNAVRQSGVIGLREAGLRQIFNGVTTIEEVVRETVLEEDI
jgi:type IV pilus assembly protein PilB